MAWSLCRTREVLQGTSQLSYLRISSLHCLCVAKQAMAHILISTPVWNCFPLMSHTPWLGVATVRFCNTEQGSPAAGDRKSVV